MSESERRWVMDELLAVVDNDDDDGESDRGAAPREMRARVEKDHQGTGELELRGGPRGALQFGCGRGQVVPRRVIFLLWKDVRL